MKLKNLIRVSKLKASKYSSFCEEREYFRLGGETT